MGKRTTVALGLTVSACMCWAIATATAGEGAQPAGKKVVDPRSRFTVTPNKIQLSEEQLRINESAVDTRDRSYLIQSRPRDISDVLPTWPAVAPLGTREQQLLGGPRNVGTLHCQFEPCTNQIYENTGGNSIGSFGDPDNIPLCDDVNFLPSSTDRFVCRINVSVGGITGGGATDSFTMSMRSGNFLPICPDDPASLVLFCETRNFQLVNPPVIVTFDMDPPILIDSNFVWICMQSENGDAAWSISTTAEQGFTEDDIVIPNTVRVWPDCEPGNGGTGFCEDLGAGQTDDYFFYGGPPTIAGMYIEIFANPGPLGACCNRDNEPATCADSVTRAACIALSSTAKWKEGVCADFDDTTPLCTTCLTEADCLTADPGGSAEPNCGPGYVDVTNQGCEAAPNAFEALACGESVCGTAGTFQSFCTADTDCNQGVTCVSSVCQGSDDARDSDWYQIVLTQDTAVTVTIEARFDVEAILVQNGGDPQNCVADPTFLNFATGKACDVVTINRCLPAGTWWVRVRPDAFSGVACSTRYLITLSCGSCSLPTGACCEESEAGCAQLAQIACEGRGGQYLGDNTTCGVEGADCPGIPSNDACEDKISLTALAVSLTFDTSFANDTDLPPAGQDVPAACEFGNNTAPLPAIRQDVFYNYRIPTVYNGVAVQSGVLVISTFGFEAENEGGGGLDTFVVVYGDAVAQGGGQACGATLCEEAQIACSDDRLNDGTEFKRNSLSHLELPVEINSNQFFDPGDCIKIRVGRGRAGVVPSRPLGGPGFLNIDFIPTSPAPFVQGAGGTGRCCFYDSGTEAVACQISNVDTDCNNAGGFYRQFTDFNQGDPLGLEDYAGCKSDPCPETGDACYTAINLNAEFGGGSGVLTRDTHGILWCKYTVPVGVTGVLFESCGSDGFFNPFVGVFTASAFNASTGDCVIPASTQTWPDNPTALALQDDCTADQADSSIQSSCIGPINFTGNFCACIPVGAADPTGEAGEGDTIYIACGNSNVAGGQFEFTGSPRPVIVPATDPLDEPLHYVLTVTSFTTGCISCPATCPGGSNAEGEAICEDSNDPGTVDALGPQDTFNGGCFAVPPTFNYPLITCSTTPYVICGKAGNFRNPFPCDAPADCPNTEPCAGGACEDASFINRDTDWYKVEVLTAATIRWRAVSMEFAPEMAIIGDPSGDCQNAVTLAFDSITFPCEPPTGTANTLEVTAAVCAGTYYVYVAPNVFGGVGEAPCSADYTVELSCEPFVQLAECCPGDMNNDGKVNGRDISKWIDTLFFPPTIFDEFQGCFAANFCRGDLSNDGQITLAGDLNPFVNLLVQLSKPVCTPVGADCFDPASGQPPGPLETGEVGAVQSDIDTSNDRRAADCFCPTENGVITNICWWGTYLNVAGDECGPEPDCFKVTFRNNNNGAGRCPGTVLAPGALAPDGWQFLDSGTGAVTRTATGGTIAPTGTTEGGTVTEYAYTATLAVPIAVTAGQCLWIEIVNDTPVSDCKWYWETSPLGDSLHAEIDVDTAPPEGDPPSGTLPTDYSACSSVNVVALDMAFSLGVRIDKEGCGPPPGRCCYDIAPLGTLDCLVTTKDRCEAIYFGEWVEGGSCPPSPACTVGRCCYINPANPTQTLCANTMKSTCDNLDQTSPQLSPRPGLWTAATTCATACPTGHCCSGDPAACTIETEIRCLDLGGTAWSAGTNCTGFTCPTAICDDGARCQTPHVLSNVQQGGYVSDADNSTLTADDFRPNANGTISQICWRGFHSSNGCDGGVGGAETFRVRFFRTTGSLPDITQQLGGDYNVTPAKTIPIPNEASGGTLNSQQYKYDAFLNPPISVSAGQCYWVEIQNTTVAASCVWLWATSTEGNNRAAIRNTGGGAFNYQLLDRDLAFCLGLVSVNAASCAYTPAVPTNNACASAILISTNVTVVGTTIGATRDGTAQCGNSNTTAGDVWYRVNSGPDIGISPNRTMTIALCGIGTTYDSVISAHQTVPAVPVECPGTTGTSTLPTTQHCDDEGCTTGLGTNQLFFPNRQARKVLPDASINPNTDYLIRVAGKEATGNQGPAKGVFRLIVTRP
ncbi:MAG TPA: hypothetical protein VJZ71_14965 [Phycisphaerae bacterium]|nr:hypothetical protein [Phycisphaerae bacterium]